MVKLNIETDEDVYWNFSKKKLLAIFLGFIDVVFCGISLTFILGLKLGVSIAMVVFLSLASVLLYLEGLENLITNAKPVDSDKLASEN